MLRHCLVLLLAEKHCRFAQCRFVLLALLFSNNTIQTVILDSYLTVVFQLYSIVPDSFFKRFYWVSFHNFFKSMGFL